MYLFTQKPFIEYLLHAKNYLGTKNTKFGSHGAYIVVKGGMINQSKQIDVQDKITQE